MQPTTQKTILLIGPDDDLSYLMERYARHGGFRLLLEPLTDTEERAPEAAPDVVWFASLGTFEARGRVDDERGTDGAPVIVSVSRTDEVRARELGADGCAVHPLTYPAFVAALDAVGLRSNEDAP